MTALIPVYSGRADILICFGCLRTRYVKTQGRKRRVLGIFTEKDLMKELVFGDFNAWIGVKRDGFKRVLGSFGDERVNENGKSLLSLCLEMGLTVTNTMFALRQIHLYTWQRQNDRSRYNRLYFNG